MWLGCLSVINSRRLSFGGISLGVTIKFCDPKSWETLHRDGDFLLRPDGSVAAPIIGGIPRFVDHKQNYAENFGTQWKNWTDTLSDERGGGSQKYDLLVERTKFNEYGTEGKTILECGGGGGDDTEALLKMGFSEVHSFDLSTSVERAAATIEDVRLTLSQASIFDIPYPDEAFDFVFCHRVLQHTPDPAAALRGLAKVLSPCRSCRSWGRWTRMPSSCLPAGWQPPTES